MARTPRIPIELKLRPSTLDEARDAGLTLSALKGKAWKRLGAQLYRWTELPEDPWLTLSAWRRLLPSEAVFTGASAAWLFGLDLVATDPAEVIVPASSGTRTCDGLLVRHGEIPPDDVVSIRALRATSLHYTLAGMCLQSSAVEALIVIDMAVRKRLTDSPALAQYTEAMNGRPGAARLRSLASLAAPAESPMETRLRWLLIEAGLPLPEVQAKLLDGAARADLFYPEARLIVEYDGVNHRERLTEDDRRQNLLVNAGYRLLRFTASDIRNRPDVVAAQVRTGLVTPSRRIRRPSTSL